MVMSRGLPKQYLVALVFDWDHERWRKCLKVTNVIVDCAGILKGGKRWAWTGSSVDHIVQFREYAIGERREVDWNDIDDMHNVIGIYDRRKLDHLTALARHAAEAQKAIDALPQEPKPSPRHVPLDTDT